MVMVAMMEEAVARLVAPMEVLQELEASSSQRHPGGGGWEGRLWRRPRTFLEGN